MVSQSSFLSTLCPKKNNRKRERETQRQAESFCLLVHAPHITMGQARPSKKLETQSWSPMWASGANCLNHCLVSLTLCICSHVELETSCDSTEAF